MNYKRKSRRRFFLLVLSRTPPISSEFRGGFEHPKPPPRYATDWDQHLLRLQISPEGSAVTEVTLFVVRITQTNKLSGQNPNINNNHWALRGNTVCPTRYRTRHFFNNSNTNEDIATKFEQVYVRCVRNLGKWKSERGTWRTPSFR